MGSAKKYGDEEGHGPSFFFVPLSHNSNRFGSFAVSHEPPPEESCMRRISLRDVKICEVVVSVCQAGLEINYDIYDNMMKTKKQFFLGSIFVMDWQMASASI
jgi:hypothetical protein